MTSSPKRKKYVHYTKEIGNRKKITRTIGKTGIIVFLSVIGGTLVLGAIGVVLIAALLIPSNINGSSSDYSNLSSGYIIVNGEKIPEYSGDKYIVLNDNYPCFDERDLINIYGEHFSELDSLGRCGVAFAKINGEMMPTENRGEIGKITPSGWHTVKYPGIIDDLYLYNRCHLIAYCLTGQNANELNLITGTRYFNEEGMLPFELKVARYLDYSDNNVLYRVTPIYEGNDLVAKGVEMEAYSIEDNGKGICFHVFVYNVQPGIKIDYRTGESWEE